MLERDIQAAVMAHWRALGVPGSLVAAVPNMRAHGQSGLTAGLFDLVVMSPTLGERTGWLELKVGKRDLSPAQRDIRSIMAALGVPHRVEWGRDDPIRVLEEWGAVRRSRR